MDITKISPGYPCHKYILRNINCEKDLWSYAKTFVSTAVQNGIQHELAMSMLSVSLNDLSHDSGLICPDFMHIGTTPKDSCLLLMNYTGVPAFKSCNTFYKKYDAKTPSCRICPISNIFYNGNESLELSIIKYMFLSEENFNFVTDYIDASYFRSAMDVCMEIPYSKACVVPVLSEIVKSSLKQNIRILLFDEGSQHYFSDDNISAFDIAWEDMIDRMPRERRVPSILKNNPMWESVLRKTVLAQIQSAPNLSMEEIRDILLEYLQVPAEAALEVPCNYPEQWSPVCLMDIIKTNKPSMQETTPC
ncbi:MAG: hypothetical protein HFI44_16190 [Lachnospiraceae bacterium]|nr:hypothetical protein [Lachnospiraceae bacterium]GFI02888.1 hypothetical protein IMSAGC005_01719 [Lachnospiraceae bacterium]